MVSWIQIIVRSRWCTLVLLPSFLAFQYNYIRTILADFIFYTHKICFLSWWQYLVWEIVNHFWNKLYHPEKKSQHIVCDSRWYCLFWTNQKRIYQPLSKLHRRVLGGYSHQSYIYLSVLFHLYVSVYWISKWKKKNT